jgi:hypothetical protein
MEYVRFGHLGLGPVDFVFDPQLLQYLRYEKNGYKYIMMQSNVLHLDKKLLEIMPSL